MSLNFRPATEGDVPIRAGRHPDPLYGPLLVALQTGPQVIEFPNEAERKRMEAKLWAWGKHNNIRPKLSLRRLPDCAILVSLR